MQQPAHDVLDSPPFWQVQEGQSRARQVFDEIARGLDRDRPGPAGWQVPAEPRFDPGQRFGLTSAAACPWTPVLTRLLGWGALLDVGPGGTLARLQQLESWATCVASAQAHRARLSSADIETLTMVYAGDLPRLREVLDTPL